MYRNLETFRITESHVFGVSFLALLCVASPALGVEALPTIDIGAESAPRTDRAKASDDPFRSAHPGDALSDPATDNAPTPKSSVTRAGIQILGGPAQASTYKALDLLPSVIEDSADPYGLSFNRSITVRGVSDFFLARTINGLPIQGIVGGADLFDLDDIGRIDLYRGSIPANQGLGFSNAAGVLDLNLLPPKEKLSGTISQGAGSNGFHRTFARIDSGRLPTGTSFFVSGSDFRRREMEGRGRRAAQECRLRPHANARRPARGRRLWRPQRSEGEHLSAADLRADAKSRRDGILRLQYELHRKIGVDASYYAFNRTRYVTNAIFAEIAYHIDPTQSIVAKPYYWRNTGYQQTTSGANVRLWPVSNYNLGGTIEYRKHLPWDADFVLGFWAQSTEPEPPPLHQKLYTATPLGTLNFCRCSTLATSDTHNSSVPTRNIRRRFGPTTVSGGVRLHIESTPNLQYFNTNRPARTSAYYGCVEPSIRRRTRTPARRS